jgi:hypothetical protein
LRTGFGRQQKQFGWQAEDLAFRGNQQSLQFGWGMEDIEEQMRYATGRERRQMMRQRDRSVIQYSMGMGQLEKEDDRLQTQRKWSEEDFAKELDRINTRRQWLQEDFDRDKARLDERMGWNEEEHQIQLKHHMENMELQYESFNLGVDNYNETQKLQAKAIASEREYWKENSLQAISVFGFIKDTAKEQDKLGAAMAATLKIQQQMNDEYENATKGLSKSLSDIASFARELKSLATTLSGASGVDMGSGYNVHGGVQE